MTLKEYLRQFNNVIKLHDETLVQCNSRLRTMWHYYMDNYAVNDFDSLVDLVVANRLKELMPSDVREYVVRREGMK